MFTGNIYHLPSGNYLSSELLGHIQTALAAIEQDASLGQKVLVEDVLNYTIVEGECTAAAGKPAEIHHAHIDVHILLSGSEQIGYANHPLVVNDNSKAHLDLYFGELEKENFVTLTPGDFAIFFPNEVHKPMSFYGNQAHKLKKAIIKIRFDKL